MIQLDNLILIIINIFPHLTRVSSILGCSQLTSYLLPLVLKEFQVSLFIRPGHKPQASFTFPLLYGIFHRANSAFHVSCKKHGEWNINNPFSKQRLITCWSWRSMQWNRYLHFSNLSRVIFIIVSSESSFRSLNLSKGRLESRVNNAKIP